MEGLGEVGWERVSGCEGVPGNVDGDGAVAACGGDQASDLSPDSLVPVWGVRSRGRCLAR